MNFEQINYTRLDLKKIIDEMDSLVISLSDIEYIDRLTSQYEKFFDLYYSFYTSFYYTNIKYTTNTKDVYFKGERSYLASFLAKIEEKKSKFFKGLIKHPCFDELKKIKGSYIFEKAKLNFLLYDPVVFEDFELENSLVTEYQSIMANIKVSFQGQDYTRSQMEKFLNSPQRDIRKLAMERDAEALAKVEQEIDNIYDKLVGLRTKMAKKLGFESYTTMAYRLLARTDYGPNEVKNFRETMLDIAVPLLNRVKEEQGRRFNYDKIKAYDLNLTFASGNPKPLGDTTFILNKAKKVFSTIDKNLGEFYKKLISKNFVDLESRSGKAPGGYCSFLYDYNFPFIFSNFNGTKYDLKVLAHEMGHAFQVYSSRELDKELIWPTLEACEISSMSLELLVYYYMEEFFGEDKEKFIYSQLEARLSLLPYGPLVDHFQHDIYANPHWSISERKHRWRELESTYLPFKDYDGIEYYERGSFWHKQGHIFKKPFYYIDYVLALICAFHIYFEYSQDKEGARKKFKTLCNLGGSHSFLNLLKEVGIDNPFDSTVVKGVVDKLEKSLDELEGRLFN